MRIFNYEIFERYREEKKSAGYLLQKRIYLSKIDLEKICDELKLNISELKFLSSGSFGNAYRVGDKVLKITKDKREAEAAFNLLDMKNENIVTYYDIFRYNLRDGEVYVLLMDYVEPLNDYLSKVGHTQREVHIDIICDLCTLLFDNWVDILNKEDYIKIVDDYYQKIDDKMFYINLLWDLYSSLRKIQPEKPMDLHLWNLGIKNRKLVLFDINNLNNSIRKFDKPRLVK